MAAPPPVPPPSLLQSSSKGQPIYIPNLQHNQKSLYYVKSTTACLAGTTSGILGLTNLKGFLFFFITTLLTGLCFTSFNCKFKPDQYFEKGKKETVLNGLGEGLFSYVLFWTR